MKKKLVSALLCVAMVSTLLAGCGSDNGSSASTGSSSSGTSDAAASTDDGAGADEAAPAASSGDGSVYLLNFKPETDGAWQDLAASYTSQTGTEVMVVTAADGQYKTTLQSG